MSVSELKYYAHASRGSSPPTQRLPWHPLIAHLSETGNRASAIFQSAEAQKVAYIAGILHDLGKYSTQFQRRLEGSVARVDHSTAGAKVAYERYGPFLGKAIAFAIAGHHAGLSDGRVLAARLSREYGSGNLPILDEHWKTEIEPLLPEKINSLRLLPYQNSGFDRKGFILAFFIRMLFSALVDADRLDTALYFSGKRADCEVEKGAQLPSVVQELTKKLNDRLKTLATKKESNEAIHNLRQQVLQSARVKASAEPGLFTLTVPTGGGKTLASLAFGLEHARVHKMHRLIYVIPFTSIVEQTAETFRQTLCGEKNTTVLEHHGNFDIEAATASDDCEGYSKLRLVMETWDAPLVVTTAVQFFESLFSNRPARCRKLHNIANSIVVIDEAQTMPLGYLQPCVAALDELVRNYNTSVVLCTATQPVLEASNFAGGFVNVREIAPNPAQLYKSLQRIRVECAGLLDDDCLAGELQNSRQALCIVNTRKHAHELYLRIAELEGAVHLTTLLCAKHRTSVLKHVKARLDDNLPIRLIATSLIEAGVDVDFPVVFRSLTGIDSLVQAAGRCNREGKLDKGRFVIFSSASTTPNPSSIQKLADAATGIMRDHADPLSLEAVCSYFKEVYWLQGANMDKKDIMRKHNENASSLNFPFKTIARDFRMIESPLRSVIVPYRDEDGTNTRVDDLIADLRHITRIGRVARDLQPYIVQISSMARHSLISNGAAEIIRHNELGEQFVLLANEALYDKVLGLRWEDSTFQSVENLIT